MPKERLHTSSSGFSLVEVILAAALFALLVTGSVGAYLYGQEATAQAGNRARAQFLAEEGLEAARNIRDENFANLTDGTYGLALDAHQLVLSGSSDLTDIFTRELTIRTVNDNEKLVAVTISWQQNPQRAGQVRLESHLTNWLAFGASNWANPYQAAGIALQKDFAGEKIAVLGQYAYVVRYNSEDGNANFFVIDISAPDEPKVVSSLTLDGVPTNISVWEHWAYISSRYDKRELQIVDIENPNEPRVVGTHDLEGEFDATSIYAAEKIAYLTRMSGASDEFSIFDVSNLENPIMLGSYALKVDAYDVEVSGSYAYIATAPDAGWELQILDISNLGSPTSIASLDLPGDAPAQAVAVAGNTLFISQGSVVHSVDITKPEGPVLLGSFDTENTIYDIGRRLAYDNKNLFLATGGKILQFKVIDVSDLSALTLLSSVEMGENYSLRGVAYDEATDRAFAVGDLDQNNNAFFVFRPQ